MRIGPGRIVVWYDETPASDMRRHGIRPPILILGHERHLHCTELKPDDVQEALEWDYIDSVLFAGKAATPEEKRDVWRGLTRHVYDRRQRPRSKRSNSSDQKSE